MFFTTIGNSILSWILIALVATFAIAFLLTTKSWREARSSPYYFQRRQALQQMQSYSVVTLVLLVIAGIFLAYAYSPNVSVAPRTALLTNAKPSAITLRQAAATAEPTPVQVNSQSFSTAAITENTDGKINNIVFASGINDNFEPVGARTVFGEGQFRLYATFDYEEMVDGTVWEYVWRHNGNVIDGNKEVWAHGEEGPGWVFLQPADGFAAGQYTLEVFVDGALQSQAQAEVSAGIANQ